MLTKDLLLFRTRKGKVRPSFIDPTDQALLTLAEQMLAMTTQAVGEQRRVIEEGLSVAANGFKKPKVGRGLAKLLLDRMEFEEAGAEAYDLRKATFATASTVMQDLADGSSFDAYEARLAERLGALEPLRVELFADLTEYRPLLSFRKLDPRGLLDRYNLALAQGLMLYTERLTLRVNKPDLRQIRRLLTWLKCCRLVASLERTRETWQLEVEGPAAILSMQKKYGLELANFLGAIPVLSEFSISAVVRPPKKRAADLELTQKDPLVSFLRNRPGHIPEEIIQFVAGFEDEGWRLDPTPDVRSVGVSDVAVTDFVLQREGRAVGVELFHRWHRGALLTRLASLSVKPDPDLVLGVDRALLDPELTERIEGDEQVFLFSAFPSKRALKAILERCSA